MKLEKIKILGITVLLFAGFVSTLKAFGEVSVDNVSLQQTQPFQYKVTGKVVNATEEPREVVLRAQAVFYDETAPKGDLPIRVLRKDITLVLRASETREVQAVLFEEGRLPDVRFRVEPELRIRRQRLWLNRYEDPDPEKRN